MNESPYFKQVELILQTIPHIAAETSFALKGGTAINLFVRDMPRLSVDIDLAYLPLEEPRDTALNKISDALRRIASSLKRAMPGVKIQESRAQESQRITKLVVAANQTRIKIEPNEVIRGSVFPPEERELTQRAEDMFERSVTACVLSIPDLYGGKICAALDRQHPRDLFDVKVLLDEEGITDEIRKAFVVYLASHDRPISELFAPKRKEVRQVYENEFAGMTIDTVSYEDLLEARETLLTTLRKELTDDEKTFLISLKEGQPNWSLMGIEGIEKLPAVQWKLKNIQSMHEKKHAKALEKLRKVLGY
ncbi:nucleotidyl transferase AbiEii/AbiGii toxin family protein [Candidatus Nitrospira salsa]